MEVSALRDWLRDPRSFAPVKFGALIDVLQRNGDRYRLDVLPAEIEVSLAPKPSPEPPSARPLRKISA